MTTQDRMFDAPTEVEGLRRPGKNDIISRADLLHSIVACHRVEDEMWKRLNLETSSRTAEVLAALDRLGPPPSWCSAEAWERIATSMRSWATACGNMKLYWSLRWRREKHNEH